jgi:hypothetical protein
MARRPEFDRDARRRALDETDDDHAQDVIKGVFLFGVLAHVRGDRANEAVAKENAQERAH